MGVTSSRCQVNGELEDYVEQPQDVVKRNEEEQVYKVNKTLYGVKQGSKAWYNNINRYFIQKEFGKSKTEPTLYVKKERYLGYSYS